MTRKKEANLPSSPVYERIREILESARTSVARTVNTTQVVANWLIGREIVEEELRGEKRADYGQRLIQDLATRLKNAGIAGYSSQNLWYMRQFYVNFPDLTNGSVLSAAGKEPSESKVIVTFSPDIPPILHALRGESWQPGHLHPNLSWTHYRTLLKVEKAEACAFYQIETIENNWSARELERQINSLLYERLALSKDKKGLLRLAKKGQEVQQPADIFKDPFVMEFLGLPESPKLVESELEQVLIDNLQTLLLELGKGFAITRF